MKFKSYSQITSTKLSLQLWCKVLTGVTLPSVTFTSSINLSLMDYEQWRKSIEFGQVGLISSVPSPRLCAMHALNKVSHQRLAAGWLGGGYAVAELWDWTANHENDRSVWLWHFGAGMPAFRTALIQTLGASKELQTIQALIRSNKLVSLQTFPKACNASW